MAREGAGYGAGARAFGDDVVVLDQEAQGFGDRGEIGDEGAGRPRGNRAVPPLPAGKQVIHDAGALRVGQELRTESDQAPRRDAELEAHAPAAVIHHVGHDAAPGARLSLEELRDFAAERLARFLELLQKPPVDG